MFGLCKSVKKITEQRHRFLTSEVGLKCVEVNIKQKSFHKLQKVIKSKGAVPPKKY